jgi:alpha-tubulin suppressor-like RCC1 family protein
VASRSVGVTVGKTIVRRLAATAALVLAGSMAAAVPAAAATSHPAVTHLRAAVTPATALVGTTVTVAGTVTPRSTGAVSLQGLVGKAWKTVAHAVPAKTGAYTLHLRVPKTPTSVALRVVRSASATTKAGVSATLHVRVVKTAYSVTAVHPAALTTADQLTVTGKVSPKATGSVSLDREVGTHWVSLGKAVLSKTSAYAFRKPLTAGSYKLRVSKAFSTKAAAGVSKTFTLVVTLPVGPTGPVIPVVMTTALTPMVVGRPTTTTLSASLGTAPYTWSVATGVLPLGLKLVPSGVVSGSPTKIGVTSFTVRATDALGHSGTGVIAATVAAVSLKDWGYNANGELGIVSTFAVTTIMTPVPTSSFTDVQGGLNYALALDSSGTVWAWGLNGNGQLGMGNTINRASPNTIDTLSDVVSIAAGTTSAYAVEANGSLWAWGLNIDGELGNGTTDSSTAPVKVSLTNVVAVAAGANYAIALTGNGSVWAWGNGTDGVLGNNTTLPQQTTPVRVSLAGPATAVSAGQLAAYALLADGTVQAWGLKENGQLGSAELPIMGTSVATPVVVEGLSNIVAIDGDGFEGGYALHANGTVSAWGYGFDGEMGNRTNANNAVPALIPGLTGVTAIARGHQTGYAVRSDGTVASWGYDASNELGNGDPNFASTNTPATVPGLTHVVAIGAGDVDAYVLTTG